MIKCMNGSGFTTVMTSVRDYSAYTLVHFLLQRKLEQNKVFNNTVIYTKHISHAHMQLHEVVHIVYPMNYAHNS